MKAHEEAVFKERSGLMHYVQGYIYDKNRCLHFNESYCRFDGVNFYQFRRIRTRPTVRVFSAGRLSEMVYKNVHSFLEKMYHFESTFVKSVFFEWISKTS